MVCAAVVAAAGTATAPAGAGAGRVVGADGATGVVGGADGVHARGLHEFDAALFGAVEGGGSEGAIVMMHAAAGELDGLAIEQETLFRGPGEGANAEGRGDFVDESSVFAQAGNGMVQGR